MKIYSNLNNFNAVNPIVTIGTFDGIHLGHRVVIDRLKEYAKIYGGETVVFTFYQHPRLVTSPNETNLRLLTTLDEKKQLFAELGIDYLVVLPFTKKFSELTYSEFIKQILVDKMKTHCLVVGYDHKFGKNREGCLEYLQQSSEKLNFKIEKLEPFLINDIYINSTLIRHELQEGNIKIANRYLGYHFSLQGKVVKGRKIGRKIGFPTANIKASDVNKLIPNHGVYAVNIKVDGKKFNGMLNIGTCPTFNQNADNRSIEVNIFDFEENIYNKEITLFFVDKIRNEQRFNGAHALIEQLKKDKIAATEILSV
ncbi:MAG: bifunctional riboflavin kinase/FAD synthetase [Bacteroidales bacterium]|nr:bifunctional riboflavin kinase/FAD synthetase [Bacteroidales bacterium]